MHLFTGKMSLIILVLNSNVAISIFFCIRWWWNLACRYLSVLVFSLYIACCSFLFSVPFTNTSKKRTFYLPFFHGKFNSFKLWVSMVQKLLYCLFRVTIKQMYRRHIVANVWVFPRWILACFSWSASINKSAIICVHYSITGRVGPWLNNYYSCSILLTRSLHPLLSFLLTPSFFH